MSEIQKHVCVHACVRLYAWVPVFMCISSLMNCQPFPLSHTHTHAAYTTDTLHRGHYKMSSVTDAPSTRCMTLDPKCNKARSGWNPNNIKSPFNTGVNASHYRTIGFFGPIVTNGSQIWAIHQIFSSHAYLKRMEWRLSHHSYSWGREILGGGYLNFNNSVRRFEL